MFTPVLIAGAGPVGLTLAAELARHGIESRIFDQNSGISHTSRAIAIHARTLEIFSDMGVADSVLSAGHAIHGASIFAENRRIIHLAFDELESAYRFAVDLPQSRTEAILAAHLLAYGVAVERRTTMGGFTETSSGICAKLKREDGTHEEVEAEYLIGCDGADSAVRQAVGIPFTGDTGGEQFLLADVHLDWDQPDDEWTLWFHETGVLAAFPLPGRLFRIIANADSGETTFHNILQLWKQRGPAGAPPHDPVWSSSFRVLQRIAPVFHRGRVFIAGDAAHVHSPAGGQGMNTGIQDAYNLAWKLALVLKGESAESLLESYTAERHPIARGVLDLAGRMTTFATLRHPVSQTVRNHVMSALGHFEVIQQRLVNRVGETSVNYRTSPIVGQQGRWYASATMAGDRAPHLGMPFKDTRFQVLLFAGLDSDEAVLDDFRTTLRYMADGYPDNVSTTLIARRPFDWPGQMIDDSSGEIHARYGAGIPCIFILRPDNYVSFRSLGTHPLPVLDHLATLLLPEID